MEEQQLVGTIIIGGIDAHSQTHHVVALDASDRRLGSQEFPASQHGYQDMLDWLAGFGVIDKLPDTVTVMNTWTTERAATHSTDPLFATTTGRPLSRDAIEARLRLITTRAATSCPSLAGKNVTAHTLRHTAAMRLLHAGVDATVIALWLGHEQVATTSIYIHADMTIKQQAIAKTTPPGTAPSPARPQPSDALIAFLDRL